MGRREVDELRAETRGETAERAVAPRTIEDGDGVGEGAEDVLRLFAGGLGRAVVAVAMVNGSYRSLRNFVNLVVVII